MKRKTKTRKWISIVLTVGMMMGLLSSAEGVKAMDSIVAAETNQLEIFFDEPVSEGTLLPSMGGPFPITEEWDRWQQLSLPIGNSYMGANIFGEVGKERLSFNHKTLWNGGPSNSRPDYNGGNIDMVNGQPMSEYVEGVSNAFLNGDSNAHNLCEAIKGLSNGYGAYQAWGDIYLDFDRETKPGVEESNIEIIDCQDSRIQYDDTGWGNWNQPTWNEGTEKFNDNVGSFTVTFQGTGIQMTGVAASIMGAFDVYIDGASTPTVSGTMHAEQKEENKVLFEVRNLQEGEHTLKFTSKANEVNGAKKTSYDCLKVIKLDAPTHMETTNYRRALNLADAVSTVEFDRDKTHYYREYFASHPDNVLAMKLTADGEKKLDFDLTFPANQPKNMSQGKTVTYVAEADSQTTGSLMVSGELNDNQMKFYGKIRLAAQGGTVATTGQDMLTVSGATEVIMYVSADTDYKNVYPTYRTGETIDEIAGDVNSTLNTAVGKGYEAVKERAVQDYKNIYDRVVLDMGQASSIATPELLRKYKGGNAAAQEKRYLEVVQFQFGRYLQIASSRGGDLPANLQGVWNDRAGAGNDPVPWGSDYHMNVNLQMNYWPTYITNMAECGIPIVDYVDSLREPGRVTASTYFGVDNSNGQKNGYTAHTQNTPFGWTCPGWDFSWGWSPAAVPWILQNVYEYYEYTGDVEYLKNKIYPMMEEQAKLYEQILKEVTYPNGETRLATVPAYSPEHGPRTAGNTYENTLVWQLFNDCLEAAEVLNGAAPGSVSAEQITKWEDIKGKLKPIEVGESGQIKEWYEETTLESTVALGADLKHRHLSHLLGLYPGDLVTADNTKYLEAAKFSLDKRGDDATGWGMGQRLNAWARTGDGNRAYKIIEAFFNKGAFSNLWDSHPPFQIDGNFGYTSGVAEMLIQSNAGYINLLPALQNEWEKGTVKGLVARGNFHVSQSWAAGRLTVASILSMNGGTCTVESKDFKNMKVVDEKGNPVEFKAVDGRDGRVEFETTAGKTYTLTEEGQGEDPDKVVKGDVNKDGKITTADSYDVLLYEAGKKDLTEVQFKAANVNNDGTVDKDDARLILKYAAEIIDRF